VDGVEPVGRQLVPVACTLTPDDVPARMRRWQLLRERAAPVAELHDGRLEVRYVGGDGVLDELRELAAAEQACCAFATWSVADHDGGPSLLVAAPDQPEALAGVAALFGLGEPAQAPR
jgi:hypothetical protein